MSTKFVFLSVDDPELFKRGQNKSLIQSHVGKYNRLKSKTSKTSDKNDRLNKLLALRSRKRNDAVIVQSSAEVSPDPAKISTLNNNETKEGLIHTNAGKPMSPIAEIIQILPVSQQMDYGSSPTLSSQSSITYKTSSDEDEAYKEEDLLHDWMASVLFNPKQGRVDPFATWAVEVDDSRLQIAQLIDHATSGFWSLLTPQEEYGICNLVNPVYLEHMRHSALAFYAYTIAISHNFDFLSNLPPTAKEYRSLRAKHLHVATKAVRKCIEGLPANPRPEQIPDELIGSVITLAGNYRVTVYNREYSPKSKFRSPLATLQCLDMWGLLPLLPPHRLAVIQLVNLKGGIRGMQSVHLAGVVQLTDLLGASRYLTRPMLPWENVGFPLPVPEWPVRSTVQSNSGAPNPAEAFERLSMKILGFQEAQSSEQRFVASLAITISTIAHTVEHLNQYFLDGCPRSAMLLLCESRNRAQYHVLSLPEISIAMSDGQAHIKQALQGWSNLERHVYEIVRLSLLIFNNIIIYPLPPYTGLDTRLSRLLRDEVHTALTTDPEIKREYPELLLWALILGGISDHHNLQRDWYIEEARDVLTVAPHLRRWITMEQSLSSFLWSDFVLNEEAFKFWLEISYVPESIAS